MKRILAIGNSFSEDATWYLHQILEAEGIENQIVNLYIGGCPLEKHWRNMEQNSHEYLLEYNGRKTDRYVSISEALDMAEWDAVVTQQASHDSGWIETYEPFLGLMTDELRRRTKAQLWLHETWAYAKDSTHDCFMRYHRDQAEMYRKLRDNYYAMAEKYGMKLIRGGDLIQSLRGTARFAEDGGQIPICRDGFHMNYIYGRYALGCLWAQTLCGAELKDGGYVPSTDYAPMETADPAALKEIRDKVRELR